VNVGGAMPITSRQISFPQYFEPVGPKLGDRWLNTASQKSYRYELLADNVTCGWVEIPFDENTDTDSGGDKDKTE
jgi:hypothetical protein